MPAHDPHSTFYRNIVATAMATTVALDERDRATSVHCSRVLGLSLELGAVCALSERELGLLRLVAGFHDVGKIGIPDRVLKKLTPYTEDDWTVMKEHSAKGARIIKAAELEDGEAIALAVRHHHERFDGQGYPDGLAGEAIPILSRIVAIADTYDAMARMRMYHVGRTHSQIMEELRNVRGRQHDGYLVGRFATIIRRSPFKAG
jgi:HD-GYP domain-containing protein (c-di-GMP phosphodiesterase class II)